MNLSHILIVFFIFLSCKENRLPPPPIPESPKQEIVAPIADSAMVVSARAEASRIGTEILKMGGNAFDAMIATEMALAVSFPYAGNLGGGGFMVYRTQFGEIGTLDYREKAPLAATEKMFLDKNGDFLSEKSKSGGLAVGVPGTVAGIFAVHEKFGSLPMEIILKPIIELAKNGFIITEQQAERFEKFRPQFVEINNENSIYTEIYKAGDTLRNIALAKTLERIV